MVQQLVYLPSLQEAKVYRSLLAEENKEPSEG